MGGASALVCLSVSLSRMIQLKSPIIKNLEVKDWSIKLFISSFIPLIKFTMKLYKFLPSNNKPIQ